MFHRLLTVLLIGALLLQNGREAAIGLWFWVVQEQVTEQHCINKDEPLLMCHGKCYLQQVIEAEAPENQPSPAKVPSPEERTPFHALLATYPLRAAFAAPFFSGQARFCYLPLHSVEWAAPLFRPPWA